MSYDPTTSKFYCDNDCERESAHECPCGIGLCQICFDNQETCVICDEKTCFQCDVLTESGHMHKLCREEAIGTFIDIEPEIEEDENEL